MIAARLATGARRVPGAAVVALVVNVRPRRSRDRVPRHPHRRPRASTRTSTSRSTAWRSCRRTCASAQAREFDEINDVVPRREQALHLLRAALDAAIEMVAHALHREHPLVRVPRAHVGTDAITLRAPRHVHAATSGSSSSPSAMLSQRYTSSRARWPAPSASSSSSTTKDVATARPPRLRVPRRRPGRRGLRARARGLRVQARRAGDPRGAPSRARGEGSRWSARPARSPANWTSSRDKLAACGDLTLFLVEGAAHNHNVAVHRRRLWECLARWAALVTS